MQDRPKRVKVEHKAKAAVQVKTPQDPWHFDCPFAYVGCETWCRSDAKLRAHVRNSQLAHVRLVMARLAALETENKAAGTRIAELEERVENLDDRTAENDELLEDLEWAKQDAQVATAKQERQGRKRKFA